MWFMQWQKEEEEDAVVSPPNYTMSERPPLKESSPQPSPRGKPPGASSVSFGWEREESDVGVVVLNVGKVGCNAV
jgi:hypothetical protein